MAVLCCREFLIPFDSQISLTPHKIERRGRAHDFLEPNVQSSVNVKKVAPHHCTSVNLSCSQQMGDQRDWDSRSLQPVPGSCPLSPTATCGHCHKQPAKNYPRSESHEPNTANAWWRCLTPSLATGQRPLASAHSNTDFFHVMMIWDFHVTKLCF